MAFGTLALSLSTILLNGLAFLATLVTLRAITTEQYGRVVLWLSAYGAAIAFLDFGISAIIISEVARHRAQGRPDAVKRFLMRYGHMQTALSVAAIGIALVAGFGSQQIAAAFETYAILGMLIALTGLKNFVTVMLFSHARYIESAKLDGWIGLSRLVLVLVFVVGFQWADLGAMLTYPLSFAFGMAMVAPACFRLWRPLHSIEPSRDPVFRIALKQQGIYAAIAAPIKSIHDQIPVWALQVAFGSSTVALFGAANSLIGLMLQLLQSLESTLLPAMGERIQAGAQAVNALIHKTIKYGLWAAVPMAVGAGLLAPPVFSLVFSHQYDGAVPFFRWLLILLPIYPFVLFQRPLLLALRAQRHILVAYLIGTVILVATTSLVLVFGPIGACWSMILAMLSETIIRNHYLSRRAWNTGLRWQSLFQLEPDDRALLRRLTSRLRTRTLR